MGKTFINFLQRWFSYIQRKCKSYWKQRYYLSCLFGDKNLTILHETLFSLSLSETCRPVFLSLMSVRKGAVPTFVSMQGAGFRIVQIVCPFSLLSFDIFPQSILATVALLTNKSHTDTAASHQNNNDFPFQYLSKQLFRYVKHYKWDQKKCGTEQYYIRWFLEHVAEQHLHMCSGLNKSNIPNGLLVTLIQGFFK